MLLLSQGRTDLDPVGDRVVPSRSTCIRILPFPRVHGRVRIEQATLDVKGPKFTLHILMRICWSPRKEPADFMLGAGLLSSVIIRVAQIKLIICGENVRRDVRPRERYQQTE